MAATKFLTIGGNPALLHTPSDRPNAVGLRGILVPHGHGGDYLQARQGNYYAGHCEQLADKGYAVLGVSTGDTWAAAVAMAVLTAGKDYLLDVFGCADGIVGGLGSSMAGLHLLRWRAENPTFSGPQVLFNPVSDMVWAEQQAAWIAEMQALYGGSHSTFLTQGAPRSPMATPALFRTGPSTLIVHPTDDATVPSSQTDDFVAAVADSRVTKRSPDVTGGHTGGQIAVLPRESWEFIRTHWPASVPIPPTRPLINTFTC